jgi:hypothetical protein
MTLAIGWLHDGGDTVGTWLHDAGDWHPLLKTHRRIQVARFAALFAVELARTSLARVETGAAAYLVGGAGFLVLAPAVTLIAPLAPRSFWTSVGAAALLAGALVAWEWLS